DLALHAGRALVFRLWRHAVGVLALTFVVPGARLARARGDLRRGNLDDFEHRDRRRRLAADRGRLFEDGGSVDAEGLVGVLQGRHADEPAARRAARVAAGAGLGGAKALPAVAGEENGH